jgi:hypothetical protein
LDRLRSYFDVSGNTPGEGGNGAAFYRFRYLPARFHLMGGGNGESGFYDIDPEPFELQGNFVFLFDAHGCAGGLFTVPQGSVKNVYLFHRIILFSLVP